MFHLARPFRVTLVFAALASTLVLADSSHEHRHLDVGRRHHAVNIAERDSQLGKRFDNTRFTYYDAGTNACGSYDQDSDFIVALNIEQWDGGSNCYKEITVSYQGKSAQAKITDLCPKCPFGAIDLSPGLFSYLVPGGFDQGVAYGSWEFGGAPKPEPEPEPEPEPSKTTSTKHSTKHSTTTTHKPSTTSSKHSSTTSTHKPTTTSTISSSSTSTTSTPSTTSTTSSSTSSVPTATVTSYDTGNINQFNMALVQLIDLSQGLLKASPNDA